MSRRLAGMFGGTAPAADPFFSDVVLLNHIDTLNGSGNAESVVGTPGQIVDGATHITSGQKFGAGAVSVVGTRSRIAFPYDAGLPLAAFGSETDFTIEFWFKLTSAATTQILLARRSVYTARGISIYTDGGQYTIAAGDADSGAWEMVVIGGTVTAGVYHHFAFTHKVVGNTYSGYVDGVPFGATATWAGVIADTTQPWDIGGDHNAPGAFGTTGTIDEIRMTRAVRYTGAFTPPALPFPNY